MCGRRLAAVVLAAMFSVGAYASQTPGEEGSQPANNVVASNEALHFLDEVPISDASQRPFANSVSLPVPDETPRSLDASPSVPTVKLPTVESPSQAELPLVPLPAPVWTGMAGLLGLGTIRIYNSIRKSLR